MNTSVVYDLVMLKCYATVEFLSGQHAAILTLTDQAGDWAGSGRIEVRSGLRADLYEEAYRQASFNAESKGGRLEGLSVLTPPPDPPRPTWKERRDTCGACVTPKFLNRSANALNVEPMQPQARCLNKKPAHWGEMSALRWIGSGGDVLVFGLCSAQCPLEPAA